MKTLFNILGGLIGLALLIYAGYLLIFLFNQVQYSFRTDLLKVPEIETFNLEGFQQLK